MKLQTPVSDEKCLVEISYNDRILMLGSCFTDNIGRQLADFGFDVCVNPFGTLYNPMSVLNSLKRLRSAEPFVADDCVQMGSGSERICSFSHHTSFACEDRTKFLDKANEALAKAAGFFASCNKVVITLGTSWCYRHKDSGIIVSNCLKRDQREFSREMLSIDETLAVLEEAALICEGKELVFTVSPIRHFRDGAHANQLSKSSLLIAVDRFIDRHAGAADYFPAYEIMMDELRDYRFYAEDMCHPTSQAVDYIRERFLDWALPENEKERLEREIRSFRRSRHIERH